MPSALRIAVSIREFIFKNWGYKAKVKVVSKSLTIEFPELPLLLSHGYGSGPPLAEIMPSLKEFIKQYSFDSAVIVIRLDNGETINM